MGEIDIICRDGRTIVFVEVKARGGREFGDGAEAVTAQKRRRIGMVAMQYLLTHRLVDRPCRFDVVSIHVDDEEARVDVFQNAFDVALG
jgi:putative endonuclease